MFEKINWKQEWRLFRKTDRDYYNQVTHNAMIIQLFDESQPIFLTHNKKDCEFNTTGEFYGFANISKLIQAHIVPNELLEFTVQSHISNAVRTRVTVEKVNEDAYRIKVYSPEVSERSFYHPGKNIVETLSKEELEAKLSLIIATFDEFPLLTLPFGNCFSI